ncbi:hypothetical protein HPB48_022036 [Haemaphysalis longicornis]|uniref:Uncharacterized protein n=1 Tax=Haemaphysalis longicornis TaxID=44386 RepID=A0A9J6FA47_HAELO|nr:hypothetical protein HPB48_022036 [Haemaphysalis longicornis]
MLSKLMKPNRPIPDKCNKKHQKRFVACASRAYHPEGNTTVVKAPPDGVCDFVLYYSLYYDGASERITGAPTTRMSSFDAVAMTSQRTQYGISVEALVSSKDGTCRNTGLHELSSLKDLVAVAKV